MRARQSRRDYPESGSLYAARVFDGNSKPSESADPGANNNEIVVFIQSGYATKVRLAIDRQGVGILVRPRMTSAQPRASWRIVRRSKRLQSFRRLGMFRQHCRACRNERSIDKVPSSYQVTPISQDKAAPGYQRPGNLRNPTVAALLRKVMEMEGTEAAIGGPCGMSIISQTYMALLKPGDRVVAHRCNYDWVMTLFRDYFPSWGVEVEFVDMTAPENLVKSLKAKPAKIVHWEPLCEPNHGGAGYAFADQDSQRGRLYRDRGQHVVNAHPCEAVIAGILFSREPRQECVR